MSNGNDEELENLRTAILSLKSGLMAVLESLEILSRQSDKSEEFAEQIQIIKQAIEQLPSVTSLREAEDSEAEDSEAEDSEAEDPE